MLRVSDTDVQEEVYQDAIARSSEDAIWRPNMGFEGWRVEGWAGHDEAGKVVWKLEDFPDEQPKSTEAWAEKLGVKFLRYDNSIVRKVLPEKGLWESMHASLCAQRLTLQQLLADAEANVSSARDALADSACNGDAVAPLGGELVLVDLAGADYDHRVGAAQKESAAINKSLLALKECFRSLAKVSGSRAKFRDSKLTRMLEDSLAPTVWYLY